MSEVHYKFKSSLSFEVIKLTESSITVGTLKDLINQKQSIKTSGFDLKLKDSQGKIYIDDDEIVDIKSKIIVSRVPKIAKTQTNTKKKEQVVTNKNVPCTNIIEVKDILIETNNSDNLVHISNGNSETEAVKNNAIIEIPNKQIPDVFKCSLCNGLMQDAMEIQCCRKSYCHGCITGYLFDPDIAGCMECPDCKAIVSNTDVNLTNNLILRKMINDFKNCTVDNAENTVPEDFSCGVVVETEIICGLDSCHEVEIPLTSDDDYSVGDKIVSFQSSEIVTPTISANEIPIPEKEIDLMNVTEQEKEVIAGPPISNQIQLETEYNELETNKQNHNGQHEEMNALVEHNYQDNNFTNPITSNDQFPNRAEIPVIGKYHTPTEIKVNTTVKEPPHLSIHDMDFDPVMYMKFLKIVSENWPDELRKILSNNNDYLHISKEKSRNSTGSSSKRLKDEDDYSEVHPSLKKSRYETEGDDIKYKKSSYNSLEKHDNVRYYDVADSSGKKNIGRVRSRSKEQQQQHYQKKINDNCYPSAPSNRRRSREYDSRGRDYYTTSGSASGTVPRYHRNVVVDSQNYSDDRHNKYRLNYDSNHRIKSSSSKYKRPLDR